MRFFLGGALYGDDLRIADWVLTNTRNYHQTAAIRAEIWNRTLPDSKIAGRIIAASIENAFLLLCFAFDEITTTQGT